MELVKITDTKAWSSIDIFLFSNGQQHSPPRKYHLTSEELQWWESTLSYLGRIQYGSGHSSIELYTIDGIKIDGPLQLINGAAYVAVNPPDSFIDTGYEDYLVKASRSWEKRLAQKGNDTENKVLKTEDFADPTYMEEKIVNEIVTPEDADDKVISPPAKIQANKAPRIPQRKSIIKQTQKKKLSDANNATLKRICAETDKIIPCPRRSSLKKSDVTNLKRLSISGSIPCKENVNQPQLVRSKRPSFERKVKRESNYSNDTQPVREANSAKNPIQLPSCDKELQLKSETVNDQNSRVNKTLSGDEQQVISLYKNKDIDLTSLRTDPDYDRIVVQDPNDTYLQDNILSQNDYISVPKGENNVENENRFQETNKIFLPRISLKHEEKETKSRNFSVDDNYSKKDFSNEYSTSNHQANVVKNQVTDEYIAFMNKGTLLLLKFHIKVKDCRTIYNKNKYDLEQTTSLSDMLKTEKTSQVNIDINFSGELLNANKQDRTDTKSLELLLNKFYTEDKCNTQQNENPRFLILQCACRKHLNDECILLCCHEKEDKRELPLNDNQNKAFTCQCNISESPKDGNLFKNISPEKIDTISFPQSNGIRVRTLAQKFEGSHKTITNDTNANNFKNNKNISGNENNLQAVDETRMKGLSALQANYDNPIKYENENTVLKCRFDKATQTDWSNVLLEARRQKDDTYTFHLPSLYVLKQCKL